MSQNNLLTFDSTRIINTIIAIFLVLFASLAAPKLPFSITKYLDNIYIRFILFLGIAFMATKDIITALIAVIAVMISYQSVAVNKITNKVISQTKQLIDNAVPPASQKPVSYEQNMLIPNNQANFQEYQSAQPTQTYQAQPTLTYQSQPTLTYNNIPPPMQEAPTTIPYNQMQMQMHQSQPNDTIQHSQPSQLMTHSQPIMDYTKHADTMDYTNHAVKMDYTNHADTMDYTKHADTMNYTNHAVKMDYNKSADVPLPTEFSHQPDKKTKLVNNKKLNMKQILQLDDSHDSHDLHDESLGGFDEANIGYGEFNSENSTVLTEACNKDYKKNFKEAKDKTCVTDSDFVGFDEDDSHFATVSF
jgi:hypothetical protein